MAYFVNTIDLLGDEAVAKAIVERTITEYNDDTIDSIGHSAFAECRALTSVNLPNLTSVGSSAFSYCKALKTISLPLATNSGNGAFNQCDALTSVNLPSAQIIESSAFKYCRALPSADFPSATSIGSNVFEYSSVFNTLVLRSKTLCTLSHASSFNSTPFASGGTGGTVYVPSALISQYQNATNWSTLYAGGKCNFVAIEGSEYE